MKITTIKCKCSCDYCNKEMTECEYDSAPLISLRVDLPSPKGGNGEAGALSMKICEECFKNIGLENKSEYHAYVWSHNKLISDMKTVKNRFLRLFFKND